MHVKKLVALDLRTRGLRWCGPRVSLGERRSLASRPAFQYLLAMRSLVLATCLLACGLLVAEVATHEPQFGEGNRLIRPEGYHEWVFVGSSLGMSYDEGKAHSHPPDFHNVYIQSEAYREFRSTGKFPDKTVLILEIVSAGGNASINKRGQFEEQILGIEAAVKDEKRFPEKWAYFNFIGAGGKQLAQCEPFPKQACWSCHNQHGAVDNVFVQFYPVLREARAKSSK